VRPVCLFACLAALVLAPGGTVAGQATETQLVRDWIDAVQAHRPGVVDPPLLKIATTNPRDIDLIRRKLRPVLRDLYPRDDVRNGILRRAAILHTDIAVLLPEQAAAFTQADVTPVVDPYGRRPQVTVQRDSTVFSMDGEMVATASDSAHWWMASELLKGILPYAGGDPFVAQWHRAAIVHFLETQLFGSANYAIARASEVVPEDAWVLFYAGVVNEANASPSIQSIPITKPAVRKTFTFRTPADEWGRAEGMFRRSARAGGPIEVEIRLGRVLGKLGRHADASTTLKAVIPRLTDSRLLYLAKLFLGVEESELNHAVEAKTAFDGAASLFPTAQAPLIALSEACWRAGDRAGALAALARLQELPDDSGDRVDPWLGYFNAFAADAEAQLTAVRAAVTSGGPR
jgi:hypothetical protein